MPNWDLVIDTLFDKAKFCPLCGKELLLKEKSVGKQGLHQIEVRTKICPDGHGEMDSAGGDARGPRLEFEPPDEMWEDVAK